MSRKKIGFSIDSKDLRFVLFDLFRIQDLLKYVRFRHLDRDQLEQILSQAERMAVEVFSPLNRIVDKNPPKYKDGQVTMPPEFHSSFRKYADGGWISGTLEKDLGGWGLPETLAMAIREIYNGACGGLYAFSSLTTGVLNLIHAFGTQDMKRQYMEKLAKGIYTGTMCLTEPEAGSF